MPLISLQNLVLSYGAPNLLDGVDLALAGVAGGQGDQLGAGQVQVLRLQRGEDAVIAAGAMLALHAAVGTGQREAGEGQRARGGAAAGGPEEAVGGKVQDARRCRLLAGLGLERGLAGAGAGEQLGRCARFGLEQAGEPAGLAVRGLQLGEDERRLRARDRRGVGAGGIARAAGRAMLQRLRREHFGSALAEQANAGQHAQWIAGRVETLLSHYFQPDNPSEVLEAAVDDWIAALLSKSQAAIRHGCETYLREPASLLAAAADQAADPGIRWDKAPCRFCGTGCSVLVGTKDGQVIASQGDPDAPVNRGLNCIKGYFLPKILYGQDRLTRPLLRKKDGVFHKDGDFEAVSWDEAFDVMAEHWKKAIRRSMAENDGKSVDEMTSRVGMFGSGQWTVWEGYAASKLLKAGLRSNNLDPKLALLAVIAVVAFIASVKSARPELGETDDG